MVITERMKRYTCTEPSLLSPANAPDCGITLTLVTFSRHFVLTSTTADRIVYVRIVYDCQVAWFVRSHILKEVKQLFVPMTLWFSCTVRHD